MGVKLKEKRKFNYVVLVLLVVAIAALAGGYLYS